MFDFRFHLLDEFSALVRAVVVCLVNVLSTVRVRVDMPATVHLLGVNLSLLDSAADGLLGDTVVRGGFLDGLMGRRLGVHVYLYGGQAGWVSELFPVRVGVIREGVLGHVGLVRPVALHNVDFPIKIGLSECGEDDMPSVW